MSVPFHRGHSSHSLVELLSTPHVPFAPLCLQGPSSFMVSSEFDLTNVVALATPSSSSFQPPSPSLSPTAFNSRNRQATWGELPGRPSEGSTLTRTPASTPPVQTRRISSSKYLGGPAALHRLLALTSQVLIAPSATKTQTRKKWTNGKTTLCNRSGVSGTLHN